MKKFSSAIWTISVEELSSLTKEVKTIAELLRRLDYKVYNAWHYRAIQQRMKECHIDFSHIILGRDSNKGKTPVVALTKEQALQKWFKIVPVHYGNKNLIQLIKRLKLLEYRCQKCNNMGTWNQENLTLQLDHIDGDTCNNHLENLRFLCPNCHSQTKTFCGKNIEK